MWLYSVGFAEGESVYRHFWPGLGLPRPKVIVVIPKNQPLPKYLRKKTSNSAKYHRPLRYEKRTG